jgi:hypothetical protein
LHPLPVQHRQQLLRKVLVLLKLRVRNKEILIFIQSILVHNTVEKSLTILKLFKISPLQPRRSHKKFQRRWLNHYPMLWENASAKLVGKRQVRHQKKIPNVVAVV